MAYSDVEHLMFPNSMCLGKGLYVEVFLLVLIGCRVDKEKEPFWLKPLLLKQLLYAFYLGQIRRSRKYWVLTDTSPLVISYSLN